MLDIRYIPSSTIILIYLPYWLNVPLNHLLFECPYNSQAGLRVACESWTLSESSPLEKPSDSTALACTLLCLYALVWSLRFATQPIIIILVLTRAAHTYIIHTHTYTIIISNYRKKGTGNYRCTGDAYHFFLHYSYEYTHTQTQQHSSLEKKTRLSGVRIPCAIIPKSPGIDPRGVLFLFQRQPGVQQYCHFLFNMHASSYFSPTFYEQKNRGSEIGAFVQSTITRQLPSV